jgi:hypothetical protein
MVPVNTVARLPGPRLAPSAPHMALSLWLTAQMLENTASKLSFDAIKMKKSLTVTRRLTAMCAAKGAEGNHLSPAHK